MLLKNIMTRLLTTIVTFFGVAVVVFIVIRIAPGNPIAMMLPPGATQDDIDRLRALYGFDKTIFQQFIIWFSAVLQGDFGTSISLRQDVLSIVLSRLPATLELSLLALIIAVLLGGLFAIIGTLKRHTVTEGVVDGIKGILLSVPDFLWGLILILVFGVLYPIFEISGRISPQLELPFITQFYLIESVIRFRFDLLGDLLNHMIMPALALALPFSAVTAHLLKQALKEAMLQDYVLLATSKGFSDLRIIIREAFPNAVLSTLTLAGVQLTFLIGGTVIIERLFSYEGLGNLAIDALINRDLPLIQGIILIFTLIFIVINLFLDLAYTLLNPKLRNG